MQTFASKFGFIQTCTIIITGDEQVEKSAPLNRDKTIQRRQQHLIYKSLADAGTLRVLVGTLRCCSIVGNGDDNVELV